MTEKNEKNVNVNVGIGAMHTAPKLKIGELWYDISILPSLVRLGQFH